LIDILKPKTYAGEIFQIKITTEIFQNTYAHIRTQAMIRYGQMFDKIEPFLDLEAETWTQLILLQEARQKRITVANKEIIEEIAKNPSFIQNNAFDARLYKTILRNYLQTDPKNFEDGVRESLMIQKLYDQVTASATFTEQQLAEEFKNRRREIQFSYLLLSADDYKKDVSVTEEEAKTYYEENREAFLKPPSINLEYIKLTYLPDAGVQKKVETKYKAKAIYKEFSENPDLNVLGQKYGFPVKESGYFGKDKPKFDIGLNFEDLLKAFKMKKNDIQEPVELTDGYIVYQVKDKKAAYIPDFPELLADVKDTLTFRKAKDITLKQAEGYLKNIQQAWNAVEGPKDFQQITQGLGLKTQQTPLLAQEQILSLLEVEPASKESVSVLNDENKVSAPVATSKGHILLHLDTLRPITDKTFHEQQKEFAEQITGERKEKVFAEFVQDTKKKAALREITAP